MNASSARKVSRHSPSARSTDALTDPWVLACNNSTSTIPIVMLIPRPPARKQMNIDRGPRFSI